MSERSKVPVLKTGISEKVSEVRILLHPNYVFLNLFHSFLGGLTQLVEYLAYNEAVSGSSPLTPKHSYLRQKADMVKLVDTLDLGSRSLTTLRVQVLLSVKWRV